VIKKATSSSKRRIGIVDLFDVSLVSIKKQFSIIGRPIPRARDA
jgi:hypothetical protein